MNTDLRLDMLPPVEGLVFDETVHRFKYKGKWLPLSPTRALSINLDDIAKQRIAETKDGPDGWEIRGNTLHGCLEQFLLGAADLNPGDFMEWWEPLRSCWLWDDAKVLGVELQMTDKKRIGGICDFLIQLPDGTTVLGDLKTVSSERALKTRKGATAQLGFYLMMIGKCWPKIIVDKCVTVIAGPGKTKVISEDPVDCWLAYEEALGEYEAHLDINVGF